MHAAIKTTLAALALASLTLGAQAHGTHSDTPRVDARQSHQQARIAHGVADGSLTRHEARQLRQQQRHIHQAERQAKADGVVTLQERRHLAQLQRHANRSIQHQRHDAQQRRHPAG
ncbi:MAG: hypothetical protein V4795_20705 [Pseudomonadota bacterium]